MSSRLKPSGDKSLFPTSIVIRSVDRSKIGWGLWIDPRLAGTFGGFGHEDLRLLSTLGGETQANLDQSARLQDQIKVGKKD
jgi:hypothetical protein